MRYFIKTYIGVSNLTVCHIKMAAAVTAFPPIDLDTAPDAATAGAGLDQHHRKIELQSNADLIYLQKNLQEAARKRIDLHFPVKAPQPSQKDVDETGPETIAGSETDPLRAKVLDLLQSFLDETWSNAAQNITVNGIDATEVVNKAQPQLAPGSDSAAVGEREGIDFEYEAYDSRLSTRVASLYAELESLTTSVSKLRRTAPQKAAAAYNTALMQKIEEETKPVEPNAEDRRKKKRKLSHAHPEADEDIAHCASQDEAPLKLEKVDEKWNEDVARIYEVGVSGLRRLGGLDKSDGGGCSLTETVGKAQRAKMVAEEIE